MILANSAQIHVRRTPTANASTEKSRDTTQARSIKGENHPENPTACGGSGAGFAKRLAIPLPVQATYGKLAFAGTKGAFRDTLETASARPRPLGPVPATAGTGCQLLGFGATAHKLGVSKPHGPRLVFVYPAASQSSGDSPTIHGSDSLYRRAFSDTDSSIIRAQFGQHKANIVIVFLVA